MEQTRKILKPRLNAFSSLVSMFAKRDDQKWVFTVRDCINSQVRTLFAKMMFLHEEEVELDVFLSRSELLDKSFQHVIDATPFLLHGEISVYFEDEEAVGDGAFREWLLLVCQELFKPERNLFVQSADDGRRFRPKSGSAAYSDLRYFHFAGRLIALAIKHNVQVGVLLDNVFYLQLADKPVLLEDVKLTDSTEYNSYVKVLQMTREEFEKADLQLCFAIDIQEDSNRTREVPLLPNGQDISVTFDNRDNYLHLKTEMIYVKLVKEPVSHFAQGFSDLMDVPCAQFFNTLELSDLDGLLRGEDQDAISIEAWKVHTDYENFEETDTVITWFWSIVNDMDQNRRQNLLFFWTAVRYLPMGGFANLPRMTIARSSFDDADNDTYPTSSTCFFELQIQKYADVEKMQKHLMFITESEVSIGFGNV